MAESKRSKMPVLLDFLAAIIMGLVCGSLAFAAPTGRGRAHLESHKGVMAEAARPSLEGYRRSIHTRTLLERARISPVEYEGLLKKWRLLPDEKKAVVRLASLVALEPRFQKFEDAFKGYMRLMSLISRDLATQHELTPKYFESALREASYGGAAEVWIFLLRNLGMHHGNASAVVGIEPSATGITVFSRGPAPDFKFSYTIPFSEFHEIREKSFSVDEAGSLLARGQRPDKRALELRFEAGRLARVSESHFGSLRSYVNERTMIGQEPAARGSSEPAARDRWEPVRQRMKDRRSLANALGVGAVRLKDLRDAWDNIPKERQAVERLISLLAGDTRYGEFRHMFRGYLTLIDALPVSVVSKLGLTPKAFEEAITNVVLGRPSETWLFLLNNLGDHAGRVFENGHDSRVKGRIRIATSAEGITVSSSSRSADFDFFHIYTIPFSRLREKQDRSLTVDSEGYPVAAGRSAKSSFLRLTFDGHNLRKATEVRPGVPAKGEEALRLSLVMGQN